MRLRSTAARALLALAPLATLATLARAVRGGEEATPAPIAILAAMDAEAGPILSTIATPQTVTLRGIPCVSGTIDARRVVVVATGVGKVNAAMTTTLVIERFAPAAVVFTGVAGALDPDLQPGDVVV
ncbi:MAG TPA: 5'-methylthioadenosine/S-adenosylhomocysteine nucleosidase, partial [Coriobacteriia bacterium]